MRVEEEKEVFKNLEGRLLSTKSLFENPDMSVQLFKFFHGRLVALGQFGFGQFGSLETTKELNIVTRAKIIFDAFSASACKGRFWQVFILGKREKKSKSISFPRLCCFPNLEDV